jgi:hypothetical protein
VTEVVTEVAIDVVTDVVTDVAIVVPRARAAVATRRRR